MSLNPLVIYYEIISCKLFYVFCEFTFWKTTTTQNGPLLDNP